MNELPVGFWNRETGRASRSFMGAAYLGVTALLGCLAWPCLLPNGLKDKDVSVCLLCWNTARYVAPCQQPKAGSLVHALVTYSSTESKETFESVMFPSTANQVT